MKIMNAKYGFGKTLDFKFDAAPKRVVEEAAFGQGLSVP